MVQVSRAENVFQIMHLVRVCGASHASHTLSKTTLQLMEISGVAGLLPGAAGCCRVAGLLTVLLGRDCVFFCVKFQYVRVFEHCRVLAARRVGGGGSNPEPHAFFFQTSIL